VVSSGSIDNIIMKVYHHLSNVNYALRSATFKFATADQTNWTVVDVSLSRILVYRMLHMRGEKKLMIGKSYDNMLYQTDEVVDQTKRPITLYNESPFNLVHFVPLPNVRAKENYLLECVDEVFNAVKDSQGNVLRDAITNKILAYDKTIKYKPKIDWVRENIRWIKKSFESDTIVEPNEHMQPIRFNF